MAEAANPYADLPPSAFWRTGVAEAVPDGLSGLWSSPWVLPADCRFATYGSCFAQHISRALRTRGLPWVDAEPAPARSPAGLAQRFNYSVFSSRTANIYTAAQLLWLTRAALEGEKGREAEYWTGPDNRVFDSLRPAIEPGGFGGLKDARMSRATMLRAFRLSVATADVFVFTLGLTEGWRNADTGQPYPMCPGTVAGTFDPTRHVFANDAVADVRERVAEAFALMRCLNPDLRLILTVSPVPLTATASGAHVLVATTHSKAILRAAAGELAAADPAIDYFPSFEIVMSGADRSLAFEPNLRSVRADTVAKVMTHFFAGLRLEGAAREQVGGGDRRAELERQMEEEDLACEEVMLEAMNRG
jgi:hypothetical protein